LGQRDRSKHDFVNSKSTESTSRISRDRASPIYLKCASALDSPQNLFDQITDQNIEIRYLINNAGFGGHGIFHERDSAVDQSMIQLNIVALTELIRLFLPSMVQRKQGRILNVASTVAFIPGPLQAVYYATKAYVLSLSQAIDEELRSSGTGITVTALCPGAVATGFVASSNLEGNDLWKNAKSPASVAKIGYNAMLKGKLVTINELPLNLFLNWIVPFLPRRVILRLSRKMMEKSS
ncbi:MAG: SDR family NAD(P)-dependent oxidoreductase, partial [Planctomycetota bacterium]